MILDDPRTKMLEMYVHPFYCHAHLITTRNAGGARDGEAAQYTSHNQPDLRGSKSFGALWGGQPRKKPPQTGAAGHHCPPRPPLGNGNRLKNGVAFESERGTCPSPATDMHPHMHRAPPTEKRLVRDENRGWAQGAGEGLMGCLRPMWKVVREYVELAPTRGMIERGRVRDRDPSVMIETRVSLTHYASLFVATTRDRRRSTAT